MHCWRITVATLVLATAALAADPATEPQKLPYTPAKDTTGITAPLRADGSPDYIAAINLLHGKGVTADNNGYAAFLQVIGTEDGQIPPNTHDKMLQQLGISPVHSGELTWRKFEDVIQPTETQSRAEISDAFVALRRAPWKADAMPVAADYFQQQGPQLDRIVEASKRPRWWFPAITPKEDGLVLGVLLPSLGIVRSASETLATRATFRAGSGDFDGALSDIAAIKRFARAQANGVSLIEALTGIAGNSLADESLGAIIADGHLSADQRAKARAVMAESEPWPTLAEVLNTSERWSLLDIAERLAVTRGDFSAMIGDSGPGSNLLGMSEPGQADWNATLKIMNAETDKVVAAMARPTLKEVRQGNADIEAEVNRWKDEATQGIAWLAMKRQANESREAYGERLGRLIMTVFMPSLGKAEEIRRRMLLADQMIASLLTAAEYKAKNGQWPAPDSLAAAGVKLPADIYADAPVKYILTPKGPRIYSVGENGKDDGGYRRGGGPRKADDQGVGADLWDVQTASPP